MSVIDSSKRRFTHASSLSTSFGRWRYLRKNSSHAGTNHSEVPNHSQLHKNFAARGTRPTFYRYEERYLASRGQSNLRGIYYLGGDEWKMSNLPTNEVISRFNLCGGVVYFLKPHDRKVNGRANQYC